MGIETMLLASFKDSQSRPNAPDAASLRNLSKVKALVEHSADAVLILHAESGKILVANQSALLLFEADEGALYGLTFNQLSATKNAPKSAALERYADHVQRVRAGETPEFEWQGRTPSGKQISGKAHMSSLPVNDTEFIRVLIAHPEADSASWVEDGQHVDELAALALTGASIASSLDIDKVMAVVGKQLATLLDANAFIAYDWMADSKELRLRHSYTLARSQPKPVAPDLDVSNVLDLGRPLQKQANASTTSANEKKTMKSAGAATVLVLPLIAQSKTIGLAELQDKREGRTFSSREIYLAQTLCHQAAVAIENARLFQATRRQLQELTILQQVANATTEANTVDELIESATQLIRHSIYSDNFGIILLGEDGQLHIHPSYESAPEVASKPIPLGQGVTGRVAQTGKPMRIADTSQEANYLGYDQQTLSELCVPMKIGDRVIGIINTESRELNHFTEDDERLLLTLAGQLATGIERLRNAAAESRRTHQLAVLNELTNRMSGVLERDKLFEIIVECLHRRMGYYSTDISRVDDDTQSYIVEAVAGGFELVAERQGYVQPFGMGLLGQAARTGEVVYTNNTSKTPNFLQVEGFAKIQSEIVIPIKIYNKVYALLNIESQQANAFDDYEIAALSTLGDQISMFLESVHLFESTKRQLQELTVLHAITQAAVNARNEDELIERATEIIGASLYTDKFGFLTMHPDGDKLIVHPAYRGIAPQDLSRVVSLAEGVTGRVAATGKAWRVPDVRKEPSYMRVNPNMRSELCVPILGNGNRVLGVINAESVRVNAFTDSDLRLLSTIAGQTGTAIEKLRLLQSERFQRSQAETLREVAAILGSAADRASVLDLILEQLKRVVPFDSASVQLVRGENLIVHAVAGNLDSAIVGLELPIKEDKFAHPLLFEQRTVLYEDISEHPDWLQLEGAQGVKSWIGAPLIARGACIGVLTVDGYTAKQFSQADADLVASFAIHAGIALENVRLFEEAQDAYLQTVSALASAIDVRDTYTSGHSQRLVDMAVETGRLLGCTPEELVDIKWGALLHDIGKIGVPDEILRKPSSLEQAELEVMRQHPEIGARIVEPVRNLASVAPIIRAHQERYDGTGYPDGLKGDQIPKIARIISVADAYVAMTDERVYRKARSKEEAIAELKRCSGSQFDPQVVEAFLQVLDTCNGDES
ncbi:MAG: GAF domain-containing protein [Anaerolineales bacterium]|nr:MAG: GAF domain-containing protein [Anaerolineales bacterium]